MKRLFLLFTLIIAVSFQANTQSYKVDWGPTYKKDGGLFGYYKLIGIEGDHYYVLMNPKRKNTLLKYDMNHKLVSNKALDMKYKGDNIMINRILHTKNGTFGYLSEYDKKQKAEKIFVSEFNDGKFGKVREVYSHKYDVKLKLTLFGLTNSWNSDSSTLIESADGSHVVYTDVISTVDNKDQEEISVVVFDADMNIVWKKKQRFKYQDKKIDVDQTVVGNDGSVYILAKVWEKKKKSKGKSKKEKGLPKFDFKAFKITDAGMKEYQLNLGTGIAPTDAGIYFPNDTQEFVLAGFYTDAEKKSGLKGVFYASGNSDTGIKNTSTHDFKASFLEGMVRKKDIEKDRGIRSNFYIEDFIEFNDGSIAFIAEENYITSVTTTDSRGNTRTTYTYHTNEIIMPRFSNDGELINIEKIQKNFSSSSSYITSYNLSVYNNKTYLIFNDLKTKSDLKEMKGKDKEKKKRRWRYTDMAVINGDGEIEYNETLFNSNEIDLEFMPFMSDYSGNKILIGSARIKKYAFGVINLD